MAKTAGRNRPPLYVNRGPTRTTNHNKENSMKRLLLYAAAAAALAVYAIPAADLTAFGVTYSVSGTGPTPTWRLHPSYGHQWCRILIGRVGVNAFAFGTAGLTGPAPGTSAGHTFLTGGLNRERLQSYGRIFLLLSQYTAGYDPGPAREQHARYPVRVGVDGRQYLHVLRCLAANLQGRLGWLQEPAELQCKLRQREFAGCSLTNDN